MTLLRRAIDIVTRDPRPRPGAMKLSRRFPVVIGLRSREWLHGRDKARFPPSPTHGATRLPSVEVDSYNVELKDDEGFIGDRASKGAFRDIIENWRKPLRKAGDDPFGDEAERRDQQEDSSTTLLTKGDPEAAGIVQGAIEDFAQELALVIRRFLKPKAWRTPSASSSAAASARAASASSRSAAPR